MLLAWLVGCAEPSPPEPAGPPEVFDEYGTELPGAVHVWSGALAAAGGEHPFDAAAASITGDVERHERFGASLVAADLTGDGLPELVVADETYLEPWVVWLAGDHDEIAGGFPTAD